MAKWRKNFANHFAVTFESPDPACGYICVMNSDMICPV